VVSWIGNKSKNWHDEKLEFFLTRKRPVKNTKKIENIRGKNVQSTLISQKERVRVETKDVRSKTL